MFNLAYSLFENFNGVTDPRQPENDATNCLIVESANSSIARFCGQNPQRLLAVAIAKCRDMLEGLMICVDTRFGGTD